MAFIKHRDSFTLYGLLVRSRDTGHNGQTDYNFLEDWLWKAARCHWLLINTTSQRLIVCVGKVAVTAHIPTYLLNYKHAKLYFWINISCGNTLWKPVRKKRRPSQHGVYLFRLIHLHFRVIVRVSCWRWCACGWPITQYKCPLCSLNTINVSIMYCLFMRSYVASIVCIRTEHATFPCLSIFEVRS